jgi:hypothetical protein
VVHRQFFALRPQPGRLDPLATEMRDDLRGPIARAPVQPRAASDASGARTLVEQIAADLLALTEVIRRQYARRGLRSRPAADTRQREGPRPWAAQWRHASHLF